EAARPSVCGSATACAHARECPPALSCARVDGMKQVLVPTLAELFDRERLHSSIRAALVMHELHGRHVVLDHSNFLQRRDDEQLQIERAEELQAIPRALVGTATEGFIDYHEPKVTLSCLRVAEPELVGECCRQNRVSEFFFLTAGLARRIAK